MTQFANSFESIALNWPTIDPESQPHPVTTVAPRPSSHVGDDEPLVLQLGEELVDPVLRAHLLHHVEQPEQLLDADRDAVRAQLLQDLLVLLGAEKQEM